MDYRDENGYYYSDDEDAFSPRERRTAGANNNSPSRHRSPIEARIKKAEKKKQRKKFMRRILAVCLLSFLVCVIIVSGVLIGMYTAVSTELEDMNIHNLTLNTPSYIYYGENDKTPDVVSTADNILWVDYDKISDNMKDAIVAIEDERFYQHNGVDFKRTAGAIFKFMLSKIGIGEADYGGSTITQQVIKNITQEKDRTATRKVKEIMRAIALEKQFSKDEILTLYLNVVYFANKCYGVESAANTYFDKSASELDIAEAAMIAGITQRPSAFNPYTNPDNALSKRNIVLKKMYELGKISEEEYEDAKESKLGVVDKNSSSNSSITSYFEDQLILDILNDLQTQHGYSEDYAKQQLYNGGLKIYATADPEIQEIMEDVYENTSNFPNKSIQSAMTVIDPYTGQIKGIVGGIGKKTGSHILNRATQSKRQPGSAIKPLSAYAPALEKGKITAASVITDEEITIGSDDWTPSNSYKGFKGDMTVREAIGRSTNTIAVQVVDKIGINTSYTYLKDTFRLSGIESKDKNYSSLSLGGLTKGASTTEMAAAYATFVNSGKYIKPHTYTKVVDSNGKILLENSEKGTRAIKATTAYIMSDLLLAPVNESYGTARVAKIPGIDTYGKTGTTNDNFDKWFIGYTTHYVGAVWTGYDSPKAISSSSNPSTAVWAKIMKQIHNDLDNKEMKQPSDIVEADVCEITGKLAKKSCPEITAYFESGDQPVQFCKGHKSNSATTPKPTESADPDEDGENTENDDENITSESDDENEGTSSTKSPAKTTSPQTTKSPSSGASENNSSSGSSSSEGSTSNSSGTGSEASIPLKSE